MTVKFTPIRVVCQNTLMLALGDGSPAHRVRHTPNMSERLKQVAELMALSQQVFAGASDVFIAMAGRQMRPPLMEEYLEKVYPPTDAQKRKGRKPPAWDAVMELFEGAPDLQFRPIQGTLWAAYNAITAH